jgi:putative ABC transport system ATP-binding protein
MVAGCRRHEAVFVGESMTMVKLTDVVKTYRMGTVEVPALKGASLSVEAGDFVAIMGPSGCGKSTLLNILGCLDRPTSGRVEIDGSDVAQMSKTALAAMRNQKIGFIFQNFHLLHKATALSNVMLPFLYSSYPRSQRKERAMELLHSVGLAARAHHKPFELSGGQQQRVAIARALVNRPKLILADEPTGNLDSTSGLQIMALLERLNREGMTILMVTHDLLLGSHAARIVHLKDGKILKEEEVKERRRAEAELALLDAEEP